MIPTARMQLKSYVVVFGRGSNPLEMLYLKMRHLSLHNYFFSSFFTVTLLHFKLDTDCTLHCALFSVHCHFKKHMY